MDLKIKDVADLLNVSETTIRRWLTDGKIPAYRINHQYRFSRAEIEDWVMNQKLGQNDEPSPFSQPTNGAQEETPTATKRRTSGGNKQFSLYRAIHNGQIFRDVAGATKAEVINATMKRLAKSLSLDADVITDLLLDREKLMPTALNHGIAVPHARDFLLNAHQDVVAVVFPKEPIDYGALDTKPVHTLFFLFAAEDKRHLHLLAKIAHLSSQENARQLLQSQPDKRQLLAFVKDWESQIPQH